VSDRQDFLVEIGTEELPPKSLKRLAEAFREGVVGGIEKAELNHGAVHWYCTPRRLAVLVEALQSAQADKRVERRGMVFRMSARGEMIGFISQLVIFLRLSSRIRSVMSSGQAVK